MRWDAIYRDGSHGGYALQTGDRRFQLCEIDISFGRKRAQIIGYYDNLKAAKRAFWRKCGDGFRWHLADPEPFSHMKYEVHYDELEDECPSNPSP